MEASNVMSLLGIFVTIVLFLLQGWSSFKDHAHDREMTELKDRLGREVKDLEDAIALLFDKHDKDAAALVALDKLVAGRHYERDELDAKFRELGDTFKGELREMGKKFDHVADTLISHLAPKNDIAKSRAPGSRQ
ncbi:MAG: hypothetical protein ACYC36_02675 [Bellilinea sp.]